MSIFKRIGPFVLAAALVYAPEAGVSAVTSAPDSVHFCVPFDYEQYRRDHPRPAAKMPADLNAGEPRTVRMIYFLPDDRPYRAEVVRNFKARIREVRTFYSESMEAGGHGDIAFQFETDAADEPIVRRVDGQHPDSHYIDETFEKVLGEIERGFDTEQNVYLVVIDISTDVINREAGGIGVRIGKTGGFGLVTSDEMDPFNYHNVVTHELGHAFGLWHDFRDDTYVMSYGNLPESKISECNAEFLAVHPYFKPDIPIDAGLPPTIERISPLTYPEGTKSVPVQLHVGDPDGLHQVILYVDWDTGLEVKACRGQAGHNQVVATFDYNGVIPYEVYSGISGRFTSLSEPPRHSIAVRAVDLAGDVNDVSFEISAVKSESTLPRPQKLEKISGDGQQGEPGSALADPLVVEVRDQYDNLLPDATVAFAVTAGEGRLSGRFTLEHVTTNANGRVERFLTLGPDPGTNTVEVSLGDLAVETFHAVGNGQPVALPSMDGAFRTWRLPDGATARIGKGRLARTETAIDFSSDGKRFAVARQIGAWVYDAASARLLALLPGETGQITAMSLSPDGTMLAFSERKYRDAIKLWDVANGVQTATLDAHDGHYNDWVVSLAFSPDGRLLFSGTLGNAIIAWDTKTGRRVATFGGGGTTTELTVPVSISLHPDGTLLALGSYDRTVRLWNVKTGTHVATLEDHTYPVASVSFSPDGAILASGSWDRTVKLWDVAKQEKIASLEGHTARVNDVAFSRDGKTLVSASRDGTIELWDVLTRENIATLEGLSDEVQSVAFSLDGTLVSGFSDGSVKLWDVSARGVIDELEKQTAITSVAFSPDGTILAIGSDDNTIKLLDVATYEIVATLEGHRFNVTSLAFLFDGTLVSGTFGEIMLWDVATGTLIKRYRRPRCVIDILVVSPLGAGAPIATGGSEELVLWDPATGAQSAVPANVGAMSFSPDGRLLASKSGDGFIRMWDVSTLENTTTVYQGHLGVSYNDPGFLVFSPDGKTLASGTEKGPRIDSVVLLYDVATSERIATLEKPNGGQLFSGAFSPDGRILAASGHKGTVVLWNMETLEEIATLNGHMAQTRSLSFSPDGRMLGSGSEDGTVLLWDMSPYIAPPTRTADFDGDGKVGFSDFLQFAGAFGLSRGDMGFDARYDLDSDGAVGFSDFLIFATRFGQ